MTTHSASSASLAPKKLKKLRKQHLEARERAEKLAATDDQDRTQSAFRRAEKYYKTRLWEPDYNRALSRDNLKEPSTSKSVFGDQIELEQHVIPSCSPCEVCNGRLTPDPLRLVTFPSHLPGLVYLPGYLCEHQQRALIVDCLETSLRPPNVTNIDAHWTMPQGQSQGLFEIYRAWRSESSLRENTPDDPRFILQPRASLLSPPSVRSHQLPTPTRRMTVNLEPITAENYLTARNEQPKVDPLPSETVKPIHVSDAWMKGKLRWCTIGWQYHVSHPVPSVDKESK